MSWYFALYSNNIRLKNSPNNRARVRQQGKGAKSWGRVQVWRACLITSLTSVGCSWSPQAPKRSSIMSFVGVEILKAGNSSVATGRWAVSSSGTGTDAKPKGLLKTIPFAAEPYHYILRCLPGYTPKAVGACKRIVAFLSNGFSGQKGACLLARFW
jgi:hypothetical protein